MKILKTPATTEHRALENTMRRKGLVLAMLSISAALSACGQKGPLILPDSSAIAAIKAQPSMLDNTPQH